MDNKNSVVLINTIKSKNKYQIKYKQIKLYIKKIYLKKSVNDIK